MSAFHRTPTSDDSTRDMPRMALAQRDMPSRSSQQARPTRNHDAKRTRTNTSRAPTTRPDTSNNVARPKHIGPSPRG